MRTHDPKQDAQAALNRSKFQPRKPLRLSNLTWAMAMGLVIGFCGGTIFGIAAIMAWLP